MKMEWMFAGLVLGILFAFLGSLLAGRKGNGLAGAVLGLLLGPIGIIIALLLPAQKVEPKESTKAKKKLQSFAARRGDPIEEWERSQRK
jgi:hypothetical protein